MARNPLELDTYRIVDDPNMSPDQKRAAIDALWAPDITKPAMGPDLRTADVDPRSIMAGSGDTSSAPPAPAPSVSDVPVGGMSVAPPPAAPAASVAPAPTMSTISPEALASAAAEKGSTPAAPPPPGPTPNQIASQLVGEAARRALRGSPGHYVPGHEQPTTTVLEKTAPVPEEIKQRIHESQEKEQALIRERGDVAAKAALDTGIQADIEARDLRAKEAEQVRKDEAAKAHLRGLDDQFEKLRKDTELEPNAWWTHRDTGHKILALIAAGMFGLAGDPEGVSRMVKDDMERLSTERDKKLSAFRQRMEDFKGQMLSPEAANAAETALGLRAAAAEARRLAASAAAPEARANAMQQAQALETQAAQYDAQMAQAEGGAARIASQYVPGQVVGAQPGGLRGLANLVKGTDIKASDALAAAAGGELPGPAMTSDQRGQAESEIGRTVIFPDGTKLYSRPGEGVPAQKAVNSAAEILNAYNLLEQLGSKPGHSISPSDLARIRTALSANILALKDSNELGAISKQDAELMDPLSGKATGDTFSFDDATRAGIDQARQLLQFKLNTRKKSLFTEPWSNMKTGGAKAEDIEK